MVCKQREHVAGFHRESLRVCAGGYVHVGGSVRTCVYVNVIEKLVKCISWTLISPHCYDSEATKNQSVKTCHFLTYHPPSPTCSEKVIQETQALLTH